VRQHRRARPQLAEEGRAVADERALEREVRIATRLAGGLSEIVSWRNGRATDAHAVNAVSRFTNSDACSSATGATSSAARASEAKKRFRRVSGAPGSARPARGRQQRHECVDRAVDVLAAAGEAAAEAVERVRAADARLRVEHVEEVVELDHRGRAWRTGSSSPAGRPAGLSPGVSSTYFRPSDERGLTSSVELAGIGSMLLSSFIVISAYALPSARLRGSIFEMKPTRAPPTRTSKPFTSCAPFGSSAFRSYVGTNGRPEFAL
jgi:hypothetical protein